MSRLEPVIGPYFDLSKTCISRRLSGFPFLIRDYPRSSAVKPPFLIRVISANQW
jgi:hypothetical protein